MKKWLFPILVFFYCGSYAQDSAAVWSKTGAPNYNQRKWLVGGLSVAGYGTSMALFSQAWYKDYPRSSFHTFNDAGEWLQMDKNGHAWAAYNTSRLTTQMWRWAGTNKNSSVLLGAGSSLLYLLSVEYLDGRSAEWGWSWPDVGADVFGATLFASQELGWQDQKLTLKFSSHRNHYQPMMLEQRANAIFGRSLPERLLKDYNAQTYWLSANIHAIIPGFKPNWINLSLGYGAEGMYGGFRNYSVDKDGNPTFDRRDIQRYRQWYLSPDIDLTRIKTKNAFLRTVFLVFNSIKVPAPALQFSQGKFRLKTIAF